VFNRWENKGIKRPHPQVRSQNVSVAELETTTPTAVPGAKQLSIPSLSSHPSNCLGCDGVEQPEVCVRPNGA